MCSGVSRIASCTSATVWISTYQSWPGCGPYIWNNSSGSYLCCLELLSCKPAAVIWTEVNKSTRVSESHHPRVPPCTSIKRHFLIGISGEDVEVAKVCSLMTVTHRHTAKSMYVCVAAVLTFQTYACAVCSLFLQSNSSFSTHNFTHTSNFWY